MPAGIPDDPLLVLGARDWYDIRVLVKHPRKGDLRVGCALFSGRKLHLRLGTGGVVLPDGFDVEIGAVLGLVPEHILRHQALGIQLHAL